MLAITAATGQLGRLVVDHVLKIAPNAPLVAVVRNPAKAADLAARGVQVRPADYNDRRALDAAFKGVERLLFISSSEVGQRIPQHRNVVEAARDRGVQFIIYTSLLHADRSPLSLAQEHLPTEQSIAASGVSYVFLRNGWYAENHTAAIPAALAHGALHGASGDGRVSLATRADYAEAAAHVLTANPVSGGKIYELAGDEAWTRADLAAEISRQSGRTIPYVNLAEADYRDALLKAGLPEGLAAGIASWDVGASQGALFDDGRQLSRLLGHPTTPLADAVREALSRPPSH